MSKPILDQINLARAGMVGRFLDSPLLNFRDPRRDGNYHSRSDQLAVVDLLDEVAEHCFGNLEVGYHAIFHGPNGHNISRGATQHTLGFVSDCQDVGCACLNRHDRRLA